MLETIALWSLWVLLQRSSWTYPQHEFFTLLTWHFAIIPQLITYNTKGKNLERRQKANQKKNQNKTGTHYKRCSLTRRLISRPNSMVKLTSASRNFSCAEKRAWTNESRNTFLNKSTCHARFPKLCFPVLDPCKLRVSCMWHRFNALPRLVIHVL